METFKQHPVYTVDYFIKKFEAIPENKWCAHVYWQEKTKLFGLISYDSYCAQGHCGNIKHDTKNGELNALREMFQTEDDRDYNYSYTVAIINNGEHPYYQQPTPKQRILAALYDIKAKLQPEEPKEKIVYRTVVIDSAVKELQETLTEN